MTRQNLHFTMRELQRHFRAPLLWTALAGVAFVLGLVGPFGTYETMRLPGRLAYWVAVSIGAYFIAFAIILFLERAFFADHRPATPVFAMLGGVAGLPLALFVFALNRAVFPDGAIGLWPLAGYTVAISAAASAMIAAFTRSFARDAVPVTEASRRPPLLDRLQLGSRGRILHLSMQDHYVEVHTDRGRDLVLMRLADAIAETNGVAGVQIHRSHWVALDAVSKTVRRNGRLYVQLESGVELPVSRSYLAQAREAGLS